MITTRKLVQSWKLKLLFSRIKMDRKYRLSFTAASLRLLEMSEMAKLYLEEGAENITKGAIIRGRNSRTTDREFRELKFRVEKLTKRQLEILATGDVLAQKQIALLAICKLYAFIRDFVVEVLREKSLAFNYQITEGEYTSFFRRKSEIHQELENLTESTAKKIKQVTFKILEQTGLIDNIESRSINPQIVEEKVVRAVVEDDPEWLKIYLLSDMEVANRTS
ncbi:DUF1819 family protein [Rufibacter immobilis]|uniref:DUF1819 family protein n=1 Tax=Rufibacter immobilis TaxID=1348778 RepID=UPI0035EB5412